MLLPPRLLVSPGAVSGYAVAVILDRRAARLQHRTNFGRLGHQVAVDPQLRAADRRQALRMIVEGTVIGLAATLLVVVIPV
jgi:hypothetical protein